MRRIFSYTTVLVSTLSAASLACARTDSEPTMQNAAGQGPVVPTNNGVSRLDNNNAQSSATVRGPERPVTPGTIVRPGSDSIAPVPNVRTGAPKSPARVGPR